MDVVRFTGWFSKRHSIPQRLLFWVQPHDRKQAAYIRLCAILFQVDFGGDSAAFLIERLTRCA